MACLALLLCRLCAGLAMTAFIADTVRSPAVQQALRNRFPGAAGETASDCARLATLTLAFGIWFVAQSVDIVMFMAVEFQEQQTPPEVR
ncbi:unnamed protein product [Macrosiphum euphorbiae]|uniref:Uncharacterized protein n=1 Tax=Macrosiphum euphorbiae TaxID=13131 RepID=A0AAV0XBX8_9HEMI|nr:unnamed protein product [Macrosiphum euphorbiae]